MKAKVLFREKRVVIHRRTEEAALVEIKIWDIPKPANDAADRKFSLFLVAGGKTVVGIDNHKPKGPHLHLGGQEVPYDYSSDEKLLADFWDLVRKAGYEP